ncbi:MAG: PAS domain S-box protein, partial [Bacteroidota bacterium]
MELNQLSNISEILDYSGQGYALQKIVLNNNNPVDFIFLDVNHSFEKITGLKKGDLIDQKVTDVLPGIVSDEFDWIKAYGEVALQQTKKNFIQYSEVLEKWFDISAYSPGKGYFITVFTDITDIKLNELEQKELNDEYYSLNEEYQAQNEELKSLLDEVSEHKLNLEKYNTEIVNQRDELGKRQLFLTSILESAADGILVTGKNGRIDYANQKFYSMWKIPVKKISASHYKDFYDVIMPQLSNSQHFIKEIEALRETTKTDFGILSFKDGRVFERYSKPIISRGKVIGSIWSFRDITEKRRNEARLKDMNKILYGLKAINHIQSEINDRDQLISEVCNVVVDTMGFSSAMINLYENNEFVAGAQKGFDKCYREFKNKLKNNHSFYCYTKNQGKKILIIDQPEKICKKCPLAGCYIENVIYSIPIIYQQNTFGFFNVNINKRYKYDVDFQQLFKDVASELAFTLHKIELEEKSKKYLEELKRREQSLRSIFRSSP